MNLLKLYVHAFFRLHQPCWMQDRGGKRIHFCDCGYLHPEGLTFNQELKKELEKWL